MTHIDMAKSKITLVILLFLISGNFFLSCSDSDDSDDLIKEKVFMLKFENKSIENSKEGKLNFGFKTYKIKIDSKGKPIVDEDQLQVIEVVNKDTGIKSYAIYEKDSGSHSLKSLNLSITSNSEMGECPSIKWGYWWDGYDCFIYGRIITDNNCHREFFPADPTTQYLYNKCGYSNMA